MLIAYAMSGGIHTSKHVGWVLNPPRHIWDHSFATPTRGQGTQEPAHPYEDENEVVGHDPPYTWTHPQALPNWFWLRLRVAPEKLPSAKNMPT